MSYRAKKIFNLDLSKISILINPNSYLHAIVVFHNGTIKFLAHETNMEIPIYNSIYDENENRIYNTKDINLEKINSLNLAMPSIKKFKSLKILSLLPNKDSLFDTVLVSLNDELVEMFLKGQIKFKNLTFYLI